MRVLLDTNILVRLANKLDHHHDLTRRLVHELFDRGDELYLVPQVIYEFWSVATRPKVGNSNGLGLTPADTAAEVQRLQQAFSLLDDPINLYDRWLILVSEYEVSGRPAHDARLAAAMLIHNLDTLLTFNTPDFKRFGTRLLHPADALRETL